MSLRRLLYLADKQLSELHSEQMERFDMAFAIVARAHELALEHCAADAAEIVENITGPLSPNAGRRLVAAMLGTLADTDALLSLDEAAEYLGYSTHGLRKIVRQRQIRFSQNGKGPIRFRQEWLDEFVTAKVPTSDRRPAQKRRRAKIEPRHGFNPKLLG